MKTPNANAMSETESWICHQLCSGFFAYYAMDCCVDLLEKAKKHCSRGGVLEDVLGLEDVFEDTF